MKTQLLLLGLLLSLIACQQGSTSKTNDLYSIKDLRALFEEKKSMDWKKEKDAKFIYSAAMHSERIIGIGFKLKHLKHVAMHQVDITTAEWKAVEEKIIQIVEEEEQDTRANLIIRYPKVLPAMVVRIKSLSTIERLIEMEEIRYLEPMGASHLFVTVSPERKTQPERK